MLPRARSTALLLALTSSGCGLLLDPDFPATPDATLLDRSGDVPSDETALDDTPADVFVPDASIDTADAVSMDALDAPTDSPADVAADIALDITVDGARDVGADLGPDVPRDVVADLAVDVPRDARMDVVMDAAIDAPLDVSRDVTLDVRADVGLRPCSASVPCPMGSLCNILDCAPGATGACVPTPATPCPNDFVANCGCDGVTYGSECARLLAGVARRASMECPAPDAGRRCGSDRDCEGTAQCCASSGMCYDPRCTGCCMPVVGVDAGPSNECALLGLSCLLSSGLMGRCCSCGAQQRCLNISLLTPCPATCP